jgi:S-adenosylmethionine:tRNA ribosyltransferase-isomerase
MQFEGDFATMQDAIEVLGEVPLPPYIERAVTEGDKDRYQAIFAEHAGAVAAPTASLHFTKELQSRLLEGGVMFSYLTLHVGAGTFKPMTSDFANEHEMHAERFAVGLSLVDAMIMARGRGRRVVAIGTTSMRVLESLYFVGCRILQGCWEGKVYSGDGYDLGLRYIEGREISMDSALGALRERVVFEGGLLQGSTQIFIVEGFEFRVVAGLITNFHQPKSTLLMLISAFVGGDWRKIYGFALESGYRFLSYGDGSLLWR